MNKRDYLDQLKSLLQQQGYLDVYQILARVEKIFNDGLQQGKIEETIIGELGTPEEYVHSLSNDEVSEETQHSQTSENEPKVETQETYVSYEKHNANQNTNKVKKTYKSSTYWSLLKFLSGFLEALLSIKFIILLGILISFGLSSQLRILTYDTNMTRSYDTGAVVVSICNDDTCRGIKVVSEDNRGVHHTSIDFCVDSQCQLKGATPTNHVSILIAPFIIVIMGAIAFLILLLHLIIYLPSSKRIKAIKEHNKEVASWN